MKRGEERRIAKNRVKATNINNKEERKGECGKTVKNNDMKARLKEEIGEIEIQEKLRVKQRKTKRKKRGNESGPNKEGNEATIILLLMKKKKSFEEISRKKKKEERKQKRRK